MFFDGWDGIFRTAAMAAMSYAALLVFLRISGKRTLAKLNAFDLVVTVALGSTLATILLSKDVALAEGLTAFASLIGLQFAVAWISARSRRMEGLFKSEPTLLVVNGRLIEPAMLRERVTYEEVLAVLRGQGHSSLDDVGAVVLETQGELSVLPKAAADGPAVTRLTKAEP